MKTLHRHIATLLAVLTATTLMAEEGTTAYNYLDVTPSSHVYGLGGHNLTIVDDDINLVEQNPALLGPEYDHQVGLNYMRYLGQSNFMGARYGQGIDEHSAFAVGIQYYGYGKFTAADVDGTITGDFNASDINFNATYTRDIYENWRGGITLKYLYSKYEEYSAGAIAVDLGVNYYNPDNNFSTSIVIKNLGGQVKKFTDRKAKLPWDVQVGLSKTISQFRLSLTVFNMTKWHLPYYEPEDKNNSQSDMIEKDSFGSNLMRHLVFGAEFLPSDNFYVGIGYNHKVRTDMSAYKRNFVSGFSACAGLKVKAFGVGVAVAQPHTGATTFMVNLTTSIGELLH